MVFVMDFQLNNAKAYFQDGLFSRFEVVPFETGWTIKIYFKDTNLSAGHIIDARDRKVRVFKTVDAALSLARDIGFRFNGITSC